MGPPRHLWSGDWRRESEAPEAVPPSASAPGAAIEPLETHSLGLPESSGSVPVGAGTKRPTRHAMIAAAAAVLLALAIGVPLATLGDSHPSHQATTPYVQAPVSQGNYQLGNGVYTITQATPAPTTPQQQTGP